VIPVLLMLVCPGRTTTELAALIADLPGRRCTPPIRSFDPGARSGFPGPSRWSVIQALADARACGCLPAVG
jgi:hypothetical protein